MDDVAVDDDDDDDDDDEEEEEEEAVEEVEVSDNEGGRFAIYIDVRFLFKLHECFFFSPFVHPLISVPPYSLPISLLSRTQSPLLRTISLR
jgi:hypothetical protein